MAYTDDELHEGLDKLAEQHDAIRLNRDARDTIFGTNDIPSHRTYTQRWGENKLKTELKKRGVNISTEYWWKRFADIFKRIDPGTYKLADLNNMLHSIYGYSIQRNKTQEFCDYVNENIDGITIKRTGAGNYRIKHEA